jgi:hypothetical protein
MSEIPEHRGPLDFAGAHAFSAAHTCIDSAHLPSLAPLAMDALVAAVRALPLPANASSAAAAEDVLLEIDTARPQQSLQKQSQPPTPCFDAITADQQATVLPILQEVNAQFEGQCTRSFAALITIPPLDNPSHSFICTVLSRLKCFRPLCVCVAAFDLSSAVNASDKQLLLQSVEKSCGLCRRLYVL